MIRYVIDASAAAEYLLRTPLGLKLADLVDDLAQSSLWISARVLAETRAALDSLFA